MTIGIYNIYLMLLENQLFTLPLKSAGSAGQWYGAVFSDRGTEEMVN